MSKNEKSAVAQEITNKICEVFGINPSDVSVNHHCVKNENGAEMEVVDCSVNLTGDNKCHCCKEDIAEQVSESWDDVYNKVKEAFKDERVIKAQNQLKSAFSRLLDTVYRNTEEGESEPEDGGEEPLDDCDCGEERCFQCGTPCVIGEEDDEKCEDDSGVVECEDVTEDVIPRAVEIKHRLQKKFDAVIRQKKEDDKERQFFQSLKDNLLTMTIKKIMSDEYQSLTNDLDADGAGIYIILSDADTTHLEIRLRQTYNYDKPMNFDYLGKEVINGIALEISEHLGFNDSVGYIDDNGNTIFKLWF